MPRERIEYGPHRGQNGDLWVPQGALPDTGPGRAVVVLLHGGFWKVMYTKRLMNALAADLMDRGWTAWNLEYRRVGSFPHGGWPATFEDVGAGIDHLAKVAGRFRLDLNRVVTVGHSAGGHLALWAAGRRKLAPGAPGAAPSAGEAVGPCAAIGLAPVADLAEAARMGLGGGAVGRLMGGNPQRRRDRYAVADPASLLPLGVPQVVVHGDRDGAVPITLSRRYIERAVAEGDPAVLVELPGAGHMELIDPASVAWAEVLVHLRRLLV